MKKIALKFTFNSDLIEVPDKVAQDIDKVRSKFYKWLSDKSNDHNYWIYINGRKNGLCYNSEAFLDYLNNVYLKDDKEKARLVQKRVESVSPDVPVLFF